MKSPVIWAASALVAITAVSGFAVARQERSAPGVSLAREVVADASAFETYTRGAGAISASFRSGGGVAEALAQGSAYKAEQFESGMIAYGAIAALQETAFVDGVRRAARETSSEALIARLQANPESVVEIDGVGAAASRVQSVLLKRGAPLGLVGKAVKQSAYDIQHQDWSKGAIADSAGRLARIKAMSAALFTPGEADSGRLIQAATAPRDDSGANDFRGGAAFTPVTTRAAALAALAVLGAAGDDDVARLDVVLHEKKAGFCMKMAKLNLYQCLAVAGPHYEDVFCLGQHALIDTAQCVTEAAGGAKASAPAAPAVPIQTAVQRPAPGLFIPVAGSGTAMAAMSPIPRN